jgi:threonine/homoserine/homoserine lactone efflux protein
VTHEALPAYLGVVALITITPGPDTAVVMRNAMRYGWPAGVRTGVGSAAGLLIWGPAACLGIAAAAHRTARLVGRRYFERVMDSVVGVVLLALGGKLALSDRT